MPNVFDQFDAKPANTAGANPFDQFDTPAGEYDWQAEEAKAAGLPAPATPLGELAPTEVRLGGVSYAPDGTPDYSAALGRSDGGVGQSLLRGIVGRGPDIVANMLELPATANEALIRATGAEPSETGVFAGMRNLWRTGADAVRDLGYSKEMDAVGYGAPRDSGADAVAAVNPMSGMPLGERLGTVARFVPDTLAGSAMDMVATLNPLTLGGYVASRTEEVAKNRAANDKRENVSLGDLGIAAPSAAIEALLERFTTMRLLPQGTTIATPGAVDATIRIAKELGIQGTTGGIEEVIPYLAETAGTQTGATGTGALESFVGGALAEGALGATAQGAKEVAALRSPAQVETALDEETFAGGTTFADLIPPKPPITPPQQPVQQDAPVAPVPAPVREPVAPVQEATPAASIFTHEKDGSTGKSKITYSTEERSDGSRALVRNIVYEDGETFTAYLNNDGEWSKGLPARTVGSGGAFAQTGNGPQSFPSDEAALVAAKEDAGVVSEPESPAPDANLFADYDPAENQTVRRSEGNLSFPENKLTRRAVDDALSDPDPVAGAERLLLNVAAQPDASTAEKWLAEKLAPMMRALGVKLAPADPNYKYGGGFNNIDNTVWVRQANPEVVLHETLHGVTSALITNKAARSNPVVGKAVTELEDMRGFLQGQLSLGDVNISSLSPDVQTVLNDPQGPLSNAKEFVTYGMTNRPFQDFLKSLPPPPGRTEARNMWEFFKQTVTSLFGKVTPSQRSFLDALIESSADLVEFAAANPKVVKMAQKAEAAKLTPVAELPSTPPKPAVQSPAAPPSPASPQGSDSPPVETARAASETPPSRPLTSTKNAVVEGERESKGKEPVKRDAPRSNETTLEMAKSAISDNPDLPAELIARLAVSGVSSINSVEEAVLLIESERLRAARDRAAERAADPDLSDEARATAAAKFDELEMQIDAIDQATVNSGREWGRFGQMRQRMLKADYSLAALERKARKVKGAPLTREEQAEIKAMADTIAKQQAELDSVRKKLEDFETGAAVEQTYKRLLEDIKKSARMKPDVAALKKKADAAKAALRELAGTDAATMVDAATLSPEQALLDLGKYHYANGAQDIAAWTTAMESDVPEQFRKGLADLFELSRIGAAKPVLEGPLTHKQVYDTVVALVRSGVRDEAAVMKAATADIQAEHPDVDERQVRRLFTEYGKQRFPTRDADKQRVSEIRRLQKLQESIDRLKEGLAPIKAGVKREAKSAEIREREAEFARLKKAYDAKYPDADADARYQKSRATSLARQLADVQERLRVGDYSKAIRIPKTLDEANTRAAYELHKAKEVFMRRQFEAEMAKRGKVRKIFDTVTESLNLARAVMTSFDLSAVLRQGGFITLGSPIRAMKAFMPMLRAFQSEQAQFKVKEEIESRPSYTLMKQAGLDLTDTGSGLSLTKMEEAFLSRWIEVIPKSVGGGFLRGSQRAFTTFLNKLRADSFDSMVTALARNGSEPTMVEIKAIAAYINVATGRGKIGFKSEQAAAGLNAVFFAPRLVASRFNLLAGQPLYGGTNRTRNLIGQEYARFLMGVSVVMTLGYMAHLGLKDEEDDKPFVGFDPRSTDFLKMRFGKTYIDPMAGLSQVTVFLARVLSGESVTGKGDVIPLRQQYRIANLFREEPLTDKPTFGGQNVYDVTARFVRTKLAPVPGAIVNALSGENVVGEAMTPGDVVVSLVVPLSMQNVQDVMSEHGLPVGTAITMLELLGMGVQYRDPAQLAAPDYGSLDREQKNTYSAYKTKADKVKKARDDLQEYANSLAHDLSPYDMRAAIETKAEELGIDGVSAGIYKRNTTAKDKETGRKKRGVKRNETGAVELDYSGSDTYKAFAASEKEIGKLDKSIEKIQDGALTEMEKEKLWSSYQSSPYASEDDLLRILRQERTYQQELYLGYGNED